MATTRCQNSSRWLVCTIAAYVTSALWNGTVAVESNGEVEVEYITRCHLVEDQTRTCPFYLECTWTIQHDEQTELCYQDENQYVVCCHASSRKNGSPSRQTFFMEFSSHIPSTSNRLKNFMGTQIIPLIKTLRRNQEVKPLPLDNLLSTKVDKLTPVPTSSSIQSQRTDIFSKFSTTKPISTQSIPKLQRPSTMSTRKLATALTQTPKKKRTTRIWRFPVTKPMVSRTVPMHTLSTSLFLTPTTTKEKFTSSNSATRVPQETRLWRLPTTKPEVSQFSSIHYQPTTSFTKSTTAIPVLSTTEAPQETRYWNPPTAKPEVSLFSPMYNQPTNSFTKSTTATSVLSATKAPHETKYWRQPTAKPEVSRGPPFHNQSPNNLTKPTATKSVLPSETTEQRTSTASSAETGNHSADKFSKIPTFHSNRRTTATLSPQWQQATYSWSLDRITSSQEESPIRLSISAFKKGCGQERRDKYPASGSSSFSGFVLGGQKVEDSNKWPWMVSIHKQSRGVRQFLCGGSLISERHVLTAAHCFDGKQRPLSRDELYVAINTNRKEPEFESRLHSVSGVHVHPDYVRRVHYHDVAVLSLQTGHPGAEVVCLPDMPDLKSVTARTNATVLGWGLTSYGGASSDVLREATVQITPLGHCRSFYQNLQTRSLAFGITTDMICAGSPLGGVDACEGDSGGPLVVLLGSRWVQVGVVSFGYGCGLRDYPGVYTRVASYKEWIGEVVAGGL